MDGGWAQFLIVMPSRCGESKVGSRVVRVKCRRSPPRSGVDLRYELQGTTRSGFRGQPQLQDLTAVRGKDDFDSLTDLEVVLRDVLLAGVLGSLVSFEFGSA